MLSTRRGLLRDYTNLRMELFEPLVDVPRHENNISYPRYPQSQHPGLLLRGHELDAEVPGHQD